MAFKGVLKRNLILSFIFAWSQISFQFTSNFLINTLEHLFFEIKEKFD